MVKYKYLQPAILNMTLNLSEPRNASQRNKLYDDSYCEYSQREMGKFPY